MSIRPILLLVLLLAATGCGTTRWTDSQRTATEQLLISDAIDRSISQIDFRVLAGQNVYLDTSYMSTVVDKDYLISSLHQHMLASGCTMKEKKEDADSSSKPERAPWAPIDTTCCSACPRSISRGLQEPARLPHFRKSPLAKRTNQKGVAKVAVFAYHRSTGEPVWQSGRRHDCQQSRKQLVAGHGSAAKGYDLRQGSIRRPRCQSPLSGKKRPEDPRTVRVTRETTFNSPSRFALRAGDELSIFGELLQSRSPSNMFALAAIADQNYEFPGSEKRNSFASPAENWNAEAALNPIGSQGTGVMVSAPATPQSPQIPQAYPRTATPDKDPVSRLLGPVLK